MPRQKTEKPEEIVAVDNEQIANDLKEAVEIYKSKIPNADVSELALYKKLFAVMSSIPYIQKDKKADMKQYGSYKYASEAAIKEKVQSALIEHRVLFLPSRSHLIDRQMVRSAEKESTIVVTRVSGNFIDIDTGCKHFVEFDGTGYSVDDKNYYKSITGALKYIFSSSFLFPTGDDPENENEEPPQASATRSASRPTVNHTPATPTTAPRPGEAKQVAAPLKQSEPESKPETFPSTEEYQANMVRLDKIYKKGHKELVNEYLKKVSGANSSKNVTTAGWKKFFDATEKLDEMGLKNLLTKGVEGE